MSLTPWDKFYYWLSGSFPKKTAIRIHDEMERLRNEASVIFKEQKKAKEEAKAPAKKTSVAKAKPATPVSKPKATGKTSTASKKKNSSK
jgi:hypothetical protein